MKATEFLEQDDVIQTMASSPIPLETAKEEFNRKAAEFEFSGISVNDIKIGSEGTTLTLQQGNITSAVTFVWGAEEDIGPFAAVKPQQGEAINLDLTPLSPPVVDTEGTGRQIDVSNLSWLNKEAFAGLMSACGFKELPPEQELEPKPGEGSGAATPTNQQAQSPATELDAKEVPAPKPQGQPGESLVEERAAALGLIKKQPSSNWLHEEDSYTVTVQKGKDTFNVTVGGTSDADAKKKAKELTNADKVMNASKRDKKKEMESHEAPYFPETPSSQKLSDFPASVQKIIGWAKSILKKQPTTQKERNDRQHAIEILKRYNLMGESVDQKVDTQMKCKVCGHIGAEPSFHRDDIKGYEYICPECESHDVMDAPSEINHSRMKVKPSGVEEARERICQDCGYKAEEYEFLLGPESEFKCPECGGTNIEDMEESMDNQPIGLFRFIIREGKRVKIPLGEAKKKGKQPHKVVSQKPYTFSWNKKPKGEGLDEKGKKVSGQGQKVVNVPKFGKQTWKRSTKEGLGEGEISKSFFITMANAIKRMPEQISKEQLISTMIMIFQNENPRFDAERFRKFIGQ